MLKDRKFFYKAKTVNGEWVIGRVGTSHSVTDGMEETTYFNEYVGDKVDNANWNSCIVLTNTIVPVNCKFFNEHMKNCEALNSLYCKIEECAFFKAKQKEN